MGDNWMSKKAMTRLDMPEGYKHFSKTKPMKQEHFAPVVKWWNDRKELSLDGADKARRFTAKELAERNYDLDLCGSRTRRRFFRQPP